MFKSFIKIAAAILSGFFRFFRIIGTLASWILILCFFSFLIVFPQWYFALHNRLWYNIFILILFSCFILYNLGVKLKRYFKTRVKTGFGIPAFIRFLVLILELFVIHYLLASNHLLFIVPGMLLAAEFLFFLCLIKGNKEILLSWMQSGLIIIVFFEFLYSVFVFYTQKNYLFTILLAIICLAAFGYLLYDSKKYTIKLLSKALKEKKKQNTMG